MPIVSQPAPYLNPYICDDCGDRIGLDGLVETGWDTITKERVVGYCLCKTCAERMYEKRMR